jgi:predicted amidohydrolase
MNVALLICYDVEFPEVCRALALRGCNLFLVPTGSVSSRLVSFPFGFSPNAIQPPHGELLINN